MTSAKLSGFVCLVTGATKGIGKGIALQLGQAGATVYFTGRTKTLLDECAREIRDRGGQPVPVAMDHSDDKSVEALFNQIEREQKGRLDVLVNNAFTAAPWIVSNMGKKFWTLDGAQQWDVVNRVGLRGHFLCTVLAARMMAPRKKGLIVNISSFGGASYLFNVPYGVGKSAMDRMAADCAYELRDANVAMVSLWPGFVKTEFIQDQLDKGWTEGSEFKDGESVEFSGKAVVHLAADANVMSKTGKILLVGDLARYYGFVDDVDGQNHDMRSVSRLLASGGHTWMAALVPGFIRMPLFMLHYQTNKF